MTRRACSTAGHSLIETLLVVALLGLITVAVAPFHTLLVRRMHAPDVVRSVVTLPAARHFTSDARDAVDTKVDSVSAVTFESSRGGRIAWAMTPEGVERVQTVDEKTMRRSFPRTSFAVARPADNLLSATMSDPHGRARRVDVWLRHAGRP